MRGDIPASTFMGDQGLGKWLTQVLLFSKNTATAAAVTCSGRRTPSAPAIMTGSGVHGSDESFRKVDARQCAKADLHT